MTTPHASNDRRRDRARLGIAGLALLGIGVGLTTAAFTDQVWFSIDAEAASFNLQGTASLDEGWEEYATEGDALTIPVSSSGLSNLLPGEEPVTTTVYVKNDSSTSTTLDVTTTTTGELFAEGSTVEVPPSQRSPFLLPASTPRSR